MRTLAIDYEYIEARDKTNYNLVCCVVMDINSKQVWRFDLRQSYQILVNFFNAIDLEQTIFVAYNISTAEVPVTCQLMGVDWVIRTNWVDFWTEFKMFALTHPKYYNEETGLAGCVKIFEIPYEADKSDTLDLILYGPQERKKEKKIRKTRIETCEFSYTDEEFNQIIHYCEEDVKTLPKIQMKLKEIRSKYKAMNVSHVLKRGEHNKLAGISYYMCPGYPMDSEKVREIFKNVDKIKNRISIECNNQTKYEIYKANYKGPVRNKILKNYSFNMDNFTEYIKSKNLYEIWEKTDKSKKLKLEEEYLDEMLSNYKDILEPVYFARNTIKQLNSTNLSSLLTKEGFIKSTSFPFNQKTSRTSPKPKLGFVLNLTPWLRMLIHPPQGYAFVGIDFKSQEVLIAAILSKDDSMLEDYLTDIYMGQAIKTGFAPLGATKHTHPELRNGFKPISLGVSFLMGAKTLSIRFKNLFQLIGQEKTSQECEKIAEKFLINYNKVYFKYANFIKKHFKNSRLNGYYQTLDNWFYFVDNKVRETQLQNVPCQSTGAAITREAHDRCVKDGIYVITLHDALYFYCKESDAIQISKIVSQHMCEASRDLLGADYMQTETTIFTHDLPYYDKRGEYIYRMIMDELNLPCPTEFKKPKEILNIHLT